MDAALSAKFISLQDLSTYSSLSVKTLRSYLFRQQNPLPHYRLTKKILVRLEDFEVWMEAYRQAPEQRPDLAQTVDELANRILSDLQ
jgi:lambda repressor-like predicted transcriptional regulator